MVKVAATDPRNFNGRPGSPINRLIRGLLWLLIGIFLLYAAGTLVGDAMYLAYLASRATTFDTWAVLAVVSALLSLTALAGAGLAVFRRRLVLALGALVLALPASFVTEGSRCDTDAACRLMGWAALPAGAFDWSIRIRPVTEANEARDIASGALSASAPEVSPFIEKRFGDHWIVSAIDRDGWPGPRAVRIDARTGRASLVPCPGDRIRCGMQRAVVSDGRRLFRDGKLGVAAVFPVSRAVCTSWGDDEEARGFVALVRAPDIPCEVLDQSRQVGIEIARSRKTGCAALDAPSVPWRPLSPETAKLFRSRPTLGAGGSVACELHRGEDVQISVYAFAPAPSNPGASPGPLYEAYIVTTQTHLAEDARMFEAFLKTVSIGASASPRAP